MKKIPCPEPGCGRLCHPKGLQAHIRSHRRHFPVSPKKEKKAPEPKLEILTDDDPTLGNVVRKITEKYHEMESPYHKADYLKRLYSALYEINNELEDGQTDIED